MCPIRWPHAYSRGTAALNLGKPDEARHYLEQVTRARPQSGFAWLALSMAVDLSRETELADRLIAAERGMDRATPLEHAPYYHALGKVHAERGAHARALRGVRARRAA